MRASIILIQSMLLGSTFVGIPAGFSYIGFGITKALILTSFVAALLADAFTTKIGLQHGLREFNPIFNMVRKWISTNQFILVTTILGVGLGVLAMIALPTVVLVGFTVLAMVGVVGNTFLLSKLAGNVAKRVVPNQELHQSHID